METPVLVMADLKPGLQKGQVALAVLIGETYFSNFQIRPTADAPWELPPPPMPATAWTRWGISPPLDALARDLEKPLAPSEVASIPWQEVEAEPPGLVALYRYRAAPHPRVTRHADFFHT